MLKSRGEKTKSERIIEWKIPVSEFQSRQDLDEYEYLYIGYSRCADYQGQITSISGMKQRAYRSSITEDKLILKDRR